MGREAIAAIPDRVDRHGIDCDLRWGYLIAALNRRPLAELHRTVEQWARYGYTGPQILEGAALRSVLDSDLYVGGMSSEERRLGTESVSTCRSWCPPYT